MATPVTIAVISATANSGSVLGGGDTVIMPAADAAVSVTPGEGGGLHRLAPGDGAEATYAGPTSSFSTTPTFTHGVRAGQAQDTADSKVTGPALNGAAIVGPGSGSGLGSHRVHEAGQNVFTVVSADATGDGTLDLATADHGGDTVSVPPSDASGGFDAAVTYGVGVSPTPVVAADVDGDGTLDSGTAAATSFRCRRAPARAASGWRGATA